MCQRHMHTHAQIESLNITPKDSSDFAHDVTKQANTTYDTQDQHFDRAERAYMHAIVKTYILCWTRFDCVSVGK